MQDILNTGCVQICRGGDATLINQREAVCQCIDGSAYAVAAHAAQLDEILTGGEGDEKSPPAMPFPVCPGDSAHTGTLLTNGLCRRDKRRAGAARSHISSPKNNTSAGAAGSRQSQKPRIMGVFQGFDGCVNRPTAFRYEYLAPQVNPRTTTHW